VLPLLASGVDPTGHRPSARIWMLVSGVAITALYPLGFAMFVAAIALERASVGHRPNDEVVVLAIGAYAVMLFASLFVYVRLGFAMFWLHQAWKWMPAHQRFDRFGRPRTSKETFYLLIPYFNFYWMFVYNFALCDALDRMRVQYRTTQPAPRDLAMWACIAELVPFANFGAPFLWASVMKRIDVMHAEMMSQMA